MIEELLKQLLDGIKRLKAIQSSKPSGGGLQRLQGIKETWKSVKPLIDDCFRYGGGNTKSYKLCEEIDKELK